MTVPLRGSKLEAAARRASRTNLKANAWKAKLSTLPPAPHPRPKRKQAKPWPPH